MPGTLAHAPVVPLAGQELPNLSIRVQILAGVLRHGSVSLPKRHVMARDDYLGL